MFTYPASDYDRGQVLLSLLGSFWSTLYQDRALVQQLGTVAAEVEKQNFLNLMDAVRALSRLEVPIFHAENWYLLNIKQSEQGRYLPRFGEGFQFDGTPELRYGRLVDTYLPAWELPESLTHVRLICNRIADPTSILTESTEFKIDPTSHRIVFHQDPFLDLRFSTRPIFVDGVIVDQELALWVFRGDFDWEQVYRHWGYVLGLQLASSTYYRDFLNAIFDALVLGTTRDHLRLALSALTGIELVREPTEVVERIAQDSAYQHVITNQHVYTFPLGVTVRVQEDETVHAGDALVDGIEVIDLNRGIIPDSVVVLTMGPGYIDPSIATELSFRNEELPTTITTDQGFTRIEFPIDGFPLEVEAFWDEVHQRGIERGQTLAHLLDQRTNQVGEPQASNLPATINPLHFLTENVLRNNYLLAVLDMVAFNPSAPGLGPSRLLYKILGPATALLVLVNLPPQEGTPIDPNLALPGGGTDLEVYRSGETFDTIITDDLVGEASLAIWKVSTECQ